ncbi:MAG: cation diffusion facilitator family transporter [Sulfuritalea sp.]|nr:cation diffusion facilitator family transporter [Sulfuritalea sp.]
MSRHSHHHGPASFSRAFAIGIALNLGFVVVEAVYGWRVGSLALLADAGHNLSDVAGLVLAWGAALAAGRLPDHRHTYGWQRASILAAFANAVLLLVAMGSLLWEAAHRLQSPAPTDGVTIMVIAAIGVLINGATAALFMAGSKTDMNIRGAFLHMAGDALVSLGVVASGALYLWTGWTWLDPVTSIVLADVDALLRAQPGVEDVHDLHVWAMSTTDIALSAHVVMPGGHPGDAFLGQLARQLHDRFDITHPTIQIELDGLDHGCPQPLTFMAVKTTPVP